MTPQRIVKTFKKSEWLKQALDKKIMAARGYHIAETEEINKFSGGKAAILFIIFAPLAFFGFGKAIRVVYEKNL